jgi:hypothetical protein
MKKQWWMPEAPENINSGGPSGYWYRGYYDAVHLVVTTIALCFLAAVMVFAILLIVYP